MTRRLAAATVVAVALLPATACGSSNPARATKPATLHVDVRFRPDPLRPGPVDWTVSVVNDTASPVELEFPTGQRADVTLSNGPDVTYQWSRGLLFTQLVGQVTVAAGRRMDIALHTERLDLAPGTYRLHAVVTASNHMDLGVSREVTVRSG